MKRDILLKKANPDQLEILKKRLESNGGLSEEDISYCLENVSYVVTIDLENKIDFSEHPKLKFTERQAWEDFKEFVNLYIDIDEEALDELKDLLIQEGNFWVTKLLVALGYGKP